MFSGMQMVDAASTPDASASGFSFISNADTTPGGTVTGEAPAAAAGSGSIYDMPAQVVEEEEEDEAALAAKYLGTASAPAPAAGGFNFVPEGTPAPAPAPAPAASGGFAFISQGAELTPGGTVPPAPAPAPSPPSIYDIPPAAVPASAFNTRVGETSPAPQPAPAAGGFSFQPGEWSPDAATAVEERRVDPADGNVYTRGEFIDAYGGTAEWDAAAR